MTYINPTGNQGSSIVNLIRHIWKPKDNEKKRKFQVDILIDPFNPDKKSFDIEEDELLQVFDDISTQGMMEIIEKIYPTIIEK